MSSVPSILTSLQEKYAHQPIFLQTATEILESLTLYLDSVATDDTYAQIERLLVPERIVSFRVTWEDDSHTLQYNTGYRVQFNSALGPYKGGLRFDPSVNEDVLKFLGLEQIFKNALTGLPLGAGKGGSDFNPKGKSDAEIRRFCIAFMTALFRHIGPNTDVPAGDIGVGAREIGYLYGAYKNILNRSDGAMTGKGIDFGGSCRRTEATGYGVVYFAAAVLAHRNDSLSGKSAVVSGSGNVATYAAEKLIAEGVVVKTLSDRSGYIEKSAGLTQSDIEAVMKAKAAGTPLSDLSIEGAVYHEGKPWRLVTADLYFPCATQNEIDKKDAEVIVTAGAQLVCEGANMPSDLEAIKVFQESNILFGPGKAANAGGVAVSGLEMMQNASHYAWTCDNVEDELKEIMLSIHKTCVTHGEKADGSIDYIAGANIGGFKRVMSAMEQLGW